MCKCAISVCLPSNGSGALRPQPKALRWGRMSLRIIELPQAAYIRHASISRNAKLRSCDIEMSLTNALVHFACSEAVASWRMRKIIDWPESTASGVLTTADWMTEWIVHDQHHYAAHWLRFLVQATWIATFCTMRRAISWGRDTVDDGQMVGQWMETQKRPS